MAIYELKRADVRTDEVNYFGILTQIKGQSGING